MSEQHIAQTILKIYANLKWKLKIADRTADEVCALIDEAIESVKAQVHPSYAVEVIQKFEQMKNRLSEFVVDGRVMLPNSPMPEPRQELAGAPASCKCGQTPIMGHRPSRENETEYFLLCPACHAEGMASLNPQIALENWNQGKID